MKASSRNSRSGIAHDKKKSALDAASSLSVEDRIDCDALKRALERQDRLTPTTLAKIAAPLGGSSYLQQWSAYKNGRLAIPLIDKLIVAQELATRPPDLFPSLRKFAGVFIAAPPIPASRRIARLVKTLGELNTRDRDQLMTRIEAWLSAPAEKRSA